jgi:hypothetical protein
VAHSMFLPQLWKSSGWGAKVVEADDVPAVGGMVVATRGRVLDGDVLAPLSGPPEQPTTSTTAKKQAAARRGTTPIVGARGPVPASRHRDAK